MTHRILVMLTLLSAMVPLADAAAQPDTPARVLERSEILIQARHYEDAEKQLVAYVGLKDATRKDYASYLQALVSYYQKQDTSAVAFCDLVEKNHATSPWLRKARFLKAQALIRQKKHKQANAIYEAEANRLFAGAMTSSQVDSY
ncbi:MAG: hypothetical protein OSB41_04235 [Kiritimatiellae bacterium]|nr:hypothetical protein [Kiritimatiellia bacterium]